MKFKISQSNWNTKEENFLSINDIGKNLSHSIFFRNVLVENGYKKFDAKKIKGDFCYDAYYKDFEDDSNKLKYTIYCYCYDLKNLVENSELLEFSFEVQINSERGIISIETIQWNFRTGLSSKNNLGYLEKKCDEIWKILGCNNFPEF